VWCGVQNAPDRTVIFDGLGSLTSSRSFALVARKRHDASQRSGCSWLYMKIVTGGRRLH